MVGIGPLVEIRLRLTGKGIVAKPLPKCVQLVVQSSIRFVAGTLLALALTKTALEEAEHERRVT
jgi:hypothetical protein